MAPDLYPAHFLWKSIRYRYSDCDVFKHSVQALNSVQFDNLIVLFRYQNGQLNLLLLMPSDLYQIWKSIYIRFFPSCFGEKIEFGPISLL
jgi:hypothetical protein